MNPIEVRERGALLRADAQKRTRGAMLRAPDLGKGFFRVNWLSCLMALMQLAPSGSAQPASPASKPISSQFSGHAVPTQDQPLKPAESAGSFQVPDDLEIELVLAEPVVRQPVFLNFDERGRMWVVQYLQYPAPAGLKEVSRDNFWRAVYDKIPEPPPRGAKGLDKITIHEDTDGDGVFDKHKTFVDGLNIATSCVKGRGGVWVLNPPYLLFYPDKNDDDVPDGDPVVHLEGFGLEDTHSVVNSLRWGPDGWLYAAQGSTVTANVRVVAPSANSKPQTRNSKLYSQGQNIWRYHPEKHIYEIFAEGGGNAFGVEIDPQGRIFSGHNGGDTRGFHYMQGAYLRKGFEKHGELSNPYAFGYFPHMEGTKGERFTHTFVLYHGGTLPDRYQGKLFGVEPLQGRVVLSEITPDGSTFKTRDLERVVTSRDSWFRPVDIKVGPDGAIYLADWYDRQVTHTRNQEGHIDKEHGRIYRLKKKGAVPLKPFDLAKLSTKDLGQMLNHSNHWFRQQAVTLLGGRDITISDFVTENGTRPPDLDSFWVISQLKRYAELLQSTGSVRRVMSHSDPLYRQWAVRFLADEPGRLNDDSAQLLARAARDEKNVEVRAQLAASAKRLGTAQALPIIANLLRHDEDVQDPRLPLLLWWAIESKCDADSDAVIKTMDRLQLWTSPMVEEHILPRLMRRFAATGRRGDLTLCAWLLELVPTARQREILMRGFEEAFKGGPLVNLPDELTKAFARYNVGSPALQVRQGKPEAIQAAMKLIADGKAKKAERVQFLEILGEIHPPSALDALLGVVERERDADLRKAALNALLSYDDPRVADIVLAQFNVFPPELRNIALTLLVSRAKWSMALAEAVDTRQIPASAVTAEAVQRMKRHRTERLTGLIDKHWPKAGAVSSAEMRKQLQRWSTVLSQGKSDPYAGQKLFAAACASCHKLFARGGNVGPDLTSYQRTDLNALLLHVVNPNAEIREGYENFTVETRDGRSLSGSLVDRDERILVLRGPDGQNIPLELSNIAEMKAAGLSLMPEGLLDSFDEQQVRDLFAYLRSTQPLAN